MISVPSSVCLSVCLSAESSFVVVVVVAVVSLHVVSICLDKISMFCFLNEGMLKIVSLRSRTLEHNELYSRQNDFRM